jgi:hypothetical protein
MDTKNIIMQGETAKYFVEWNNPNFNFETHNFRLELTYGMMGKKITIPKSEFLFLNNHWIFSFPTNDIVGLVKAKMIVELFDPDCAEDLREEVDEQYIAFVLTNPCPQFFRCPPCSGGDKDVTYTRTEASDIGERYAILSDKNGNPLKTTGDGYLYVLRQI